MLKDMNEATKIELPRHKDTLFNVDVICHFAIRNRYILTISFDSTVILSKKFNWFQWEKSSSHTELLDSAIDEANEICKEIIFVRSPDLKSKLEALKERVKSGEFKKPKLTKISEIRYDEVYIKGIESLS
jgi:hypothetical protein